MTSERQLAAIWGARWKLLAFVVVVAAATYVISDRQEPHYESDSLVRIVLGKGATDPSAFTLGGLTATNIYVDYARLDRVKLDALTQAGDTNPRDSLRALLAQPEQDPLSIQLTARAASPEFSARVANAYAEAFENFVFEQQSATRTRRLRGLAAERERLLEARKTVSGPDEEEIIDRESADLEQRTQRELSTPLDRVAIIQPAVARGASVWPQPRRDAIVAAIFAFVIGAAVVAVRSRRRYKSPEEAAEQLDLPLLGTIPYVPREEIPLREVFRSIRTRMETASGAYRMIVLVVSPERYEGRTFVASRLAISLAEGGQRVAALDGDLRAPALHDALAVADRPGLVEALETGDGAADQVRLRVSPRVRRRDDARDRLDVLPAGRQKPGAQELLLTPAFGEVMDKLRSGHDFTVIDSPAMDRSSDALVLARHATAVVLVVNARTTSPTAAQKAVKDLAAVGAAPVGFVYNAIAADDTLLVPASWDRQMARR